MFHKDNADDFHTKQIAFDFKNVQQNGDIEGYASVFGNLDQGGDIVDEKAFDKNIEKWRLGGRMPKMLWQHQKDKVIGVWTEARKDSQGLFLKGRLLIDLPLAKEAHTLLRNDAIDGLSIGYRTIDAEMLENGARKLLELDLKETSVVTFPMNEEALVTSVKKLHSIRDVEHILRDAGVPNSFARLVAEKGYDAAVAEVKGEQREADSNSEALLRLQQSLNTLKEKICA